MCLRKCVLTAFSYHTLLGSKTVVFCSRPISLNIPFVFSHSFSKNRRFSSFKLRSWGLSPPNHIFISDLCSYAISWFKSLFFLFYLAFNFWLDKSVHNCPVQPNNMFVYSPTTELTVILWQCHFLYAELITVDGRGSELHLLEYCFFFPELNNAWVCLFSILC